MYLKLLSLEESMSGLIEIKSVPCMLSLSLFEGTCGGNLRRAKKSGTDGDWREKCGRALEALYLMYGVDTFDPL